MNFYEFNQQNYNQSKQYSGQAQSSQQNSSVASMASSFASIIGSVIDYNTLKANLGNYYVQADQIELQAQERANQLREQFNESVGSYTMNAAQRGVSVNSGSVRSNVENSAIAMGKDIFKAQQNAQMQANNLRTQAKIKKHEGKAQMYSQISKSIIDIGSSMSGGV